MKKIREFPKGNKITEKIVWSNGNIVRQYRNQNEDSVWHNLKDGYRKIVMQLYEYNEDIHIEHINKVINKLKKKYPDTKFQYKKEDDCFLTILHNNEQLDNELDNNDDLNDWLIDIITQYLTEEELNKFAICYDILDEME